MIKVKIKDLARELNLSETTVSLVLNNRPSRISEKTRLKILEMAKKMCYSKDSQMYFEDKLNMKTVVIILNNILNTEDLLITKKIKDNLYKDDYQTFIMDSNNNPEEIVNILDNVLTKGVDGVVLIRTNNEDGFLDDYFDIFSLAIVAFDTNISNTNVSSIKLERMGNAELNIEAISRIISNEILNRIDHKNIPREILVPII